MSFWSRYPFSVLHQVGSWYSEQFLLCDYPIALSLYLLHADLSFHIHLQGRITLRAYPQTPLLPNLLHADKHRFRCFIIADITAHIIVILGLSTTVSILVNFRILQLFFELCYLLARFWKLCVTKFCYKFLILLPFFYLSARSEVIFSVHQSLFQETLSEDPLTLTGWSDTLCNGWSSPCQAWRCNNYDSVVASRPVQTCVGYVLFPQWDIPIFIWIPT